jgi:hypothetical protein
MIILRRYKALQYARAAYRSAGRKPPKMAQLQIDAQVWINHPEVVAFAERACAKIRSDAPRKRR